jgi:putative ABC transport system permease protein
MKFTQALKMAFVALRGNKMRSFLTMLGIIIGVLAVTLLISVVQGATGEITGQIESLGSNLLQVRFTSAEPTYLTQSDIKALENDPSISGVTGAVSKTADVKAGDNSGSYSIEGVTSIYQDITRQVIKQGRFICDEDTEIHNYAAVVGNNVATDLFGTEDCIGNTLNIKGYNFTVVGLLEASDTMLANKDDTIIIPLSTAQRLFSDREFSYLYISATTPDMVDAAETATDNFLTREIGVNDDYDKYRIINQNAILDVMNQVMGVMTILLSGIAAISLLVGGIGIMNIMLVSVTERTREIGVRKAIGAQRSDILMQFLIEAVVLSVAGGVIGIGLSFLGLQVIGTAMDIGMSMSVGTIALSLGFSAFVGVVFGIYPANKAARLNPIEALRYE